MKIDYCYHTHTYRCGHAQGSDEEYVIEAINKGLKVIGFTDHVFLPSHPQPGIRGNIELLDEYVNSLRKLKEKYKDQIEILIGFEAEYFDEYVPYYKQLLESGKIDYLIQGQHNYIENGKLEWYFGVLNDTVTINLYTEHIIKGIESGLYSFIAHPDLFVRCLTDWTDYHEQITRRICEAAVKYDVPLEFNLGGLRFPYERYSPGDAKLRYPCLDFWKIASEYPIRVFVGPDSHTPDKVHDEQEIQFALDTIKKLNLKLETRIK